VGWWRLRLKAFFYLGLYTSTTQSASYRFPRSAHRWTFCSMHPAASYLLFTPQARDSSGDSPPSRLLERSRTSLHFQPRRSPRPQACHDRFCCYIVRHPSCIAPRCRPHALASHFGRLSHGMLRSALIISAIWWSRTCSVGTIRAAAEG
jgi:hypothetical protein